LETLVVQAQAAQAENRHAPRTPFEYARADGLDPLDTLIAASAITGCFTLATRNGKHFRDIGGLSVGIVKYV
jgi:predicted nucleic acid-binding protein